MNNIEGKSLTSTVLLFAMNGCSRLFEKHVLKKFQAALNAVGIRVFYSVHLIIFKRNRNRMSLSCTSVWMHQFTYSYVAGYMVVPVATDQTSAK